MSFERQIAPPQQGLEFRGGLAAGTDLRGPFGARHIEHVRPGDMIVTRTGGLQPVRFAWSRTLAPEQMRDNPALAPVRLRPRAIGPMMPQRELIVAPDHRLLIPGYRIAGAEGEAGVLVEAIEIAGRGRGASATTSEAPVTFYQLVFDSHQILTANGLPVESFLPTPSALASLDPELRAALLERFVTLGKEPGAYPPASFRVMSGIDLLPPPF